jgi:elongation factor G
MRLCVTYIYFFVHLERREIFMLLFKEFNLPYASKFVSRWATIREAVTGKGRYVVQTRCPADFGIVELRLEPYIGLTHFMLEWRVTDEQIPREFLTGVIAGIQQAAQQERNGFDAIVYLKVIVSDGSNNPVDSRSASYTKAAALAFADALSKAQIVPCDA